MSTAPWVWPGRMVSDDEVVVRPQDIAAIRTLAVQWDGAEHGAAGLCAWDEELEMYLGVDADGELGSVLSVLMARAAMPDGFAGAVANPFADTPAEEDEVASLMGYPDGNVDAALRSGKPIELTPRDDELAAWAGANLTERGIDPKRPFETGDAASDLARLLGVPRAEAEARLPRIEARLAYYLLAFVQRAELAPGPYHRGEFGSWTPGRAPETSDLSEAEWAERIAKALFEANIRYTEIAQALDTLARDEHIQGDYADIADRFALHTTCENYLYEGNVAEQALAAAHAFPEPGEATGQLFPLAAARALNAAGRFAVAHAVLSERKLWPREAADTPDGAPSWHDVICAEGWISAVGTGAKTMREADAGLRSTVYGQAWAYLYGDLDFGEEDRGLDRHARAVCVQLRVMDHLEATGD